MAVCDYSEHELHGLNEYIGSLRSKTIKIYQELEN